jgi:hypothetical protein
VAAHCDRHGPGDGEPVGSVGAGLKVVEYQRRGAIHIHAVLRVDRRDGDDPELDVAALAEAVRVATRRTQAPNPLPEGEPIRWGSQIDVRAVWHQERRAVANYLAKYSTKSTDDAGALDRRVTDERIASLGLPEHLEHLVRSAWRLGGVEGLSHLRLRPWAHCLGFRGHWLTKSRTYSTTFAVLRGARHEFRKAEALRLAGEAVDPAMVGVGSWQFFGVGHHRAGDALLAQWHAQLRGEERRLEWEERSWAA